MKMPDSVVVGPHTYEVVRKGPDADTDLGQCFYDELSTRIKPGMKLSKCQEILLHEVLHACGYPTLCGKDEEFVDTIAPALLQVLRANPQLIAYLVS